MIYNNASLFLIWRWKRERPVCTMLQHHPVAASCRSWSSLTFCLFSLCCFHYLAFSYGPLHFNSSLRSVCHFSKHFEMLMRSEGKCAGLSWTRFLTFVLQCFGFGAMWAVIRRKLSMRISFLKLNGFQCRSWKCRLREEFCVDWSRQLLASVGMVRGNHQMTNWWDSSYGIMRKNNENNLDSFKSLLNGRLNASKQ